MTPEDPAGGPRLHPLPSAVPPSVFHLSRTVPFSESSGRGHSITRADAINAAGRPGPASIEVVRSSSASRRRATVHRCWYRAAPCGEMGERLPVMWRDCIEAGDRPPIRLSCSASPCADNPEQEDFPPSVLSRQARHEPLATPASPCGVRPEEAGGGRCTPGTRQEHSLVAVEAAGARRAGASGMVRSVAEPGSAGSRGVSLPANGASACDGHRRGRFPEAPHDKRRAPWYTNLADTCVSSSVDAAGAGAADSDGTRAGKLSVATGLSPFRRLPESGDAGACAIRGRRARAGSRAAGARGQR